MTVAYTPPPAIVAMRERVNLLPDPCEGGPFHLADIMASEIEYDYREAFEGNESVLELYDTGWSLERVMEACLADAEKVAR